MYIRYAKYEATFTPRDDADFVLKDECRPYVGRRITVMYNGIIDGDRPKYEGDHEFTLVFSSHPDDADLPGWYSHKDLSDIRPLPQQEGGRHA